MPLKQLKLSQKAMILVAIPLAFEIVFVVGLAWLLKQAEHEALRESHSKQILAESNLLLRSFIDAGMALYLYQLTDSGKFLTRYKELSDGIPETIRNLRLILRDSAGQQQALDRVERVSNSGLQLLGQASRLITEGQSVAKITNSREELNNLIQELMSEINRFSCEQQKAEYINPEAAAHARELVAQCLAAGLMLNLVLAACLAYSFHIGTTRRLNVLVQNTELLARGESLQEPLTGDDEIGKLDHVFHDMADALTEAAKRKQELMAMVAHDLRTPLTSVQASLSLLSFGALGELPEKASEQVIVAEKNTVRLINLITDLLDIEKMHSGKLDIERRDVVLQELFDQAADAVRQYANQQGIELIVGETSAILPADPDRLIQVLVNLIGNAIKFSARGQTVELEAGELRGQYNNAKEIEIRVIDHGRGIPAEFKEKIFERFQQVAAADSKEKQGSGLGLTICQAIVAAHGGTIGVESEPGKGSTFWFRLPATS